MHRLALFCSGSGTNAQAIIDYFAGHPRIQVACLLANSPRAFALERARAVGISSLVFDRPLFYDTEEVDRFLYEQGVTCLILAGFLWLVPPRLLAHYPGRVLNIHPALLPNFGGPGMYGRRVHEAVAASGTAGGEVVSGITIHLADEAYDRGRMLFQERVRVPYATPATIEAAVRALELAHYAPAIERYLDSLPTPG